MLKTIFLFLLSPLFFIELHAKKGNHHKSTNIKKMVAQDFPANGSPNTHSNTKTSLSLNKTTANTITYIKGKIGRNTINPLDYYDVSEGLKYAWDSKKQQEIADVFIAVHDWLPKSEWRELIQFLARIDSKHYKKIASTMKQETKKMSRDERQDWLYDNFQR